MPRKETIFFKSFKVLSICLIAIAFTTVLSSPTQAQTKPAVCESKPLMQKQITASYAQSSYSDCLTDAKLCEKMYAEEPQTTIIQKAATPSPKPKAASPSPIPPSTPIPVPSPLPSPTLAPAKNSLSADKLFEMINAHRVTKGLPAYEKEDRLCQLAASRGPELHEEIYGSKYIHQGFRERNLPFWITENMISKESEELAMRWWLNSSLHRAGIESSKKYACGVCAGKSCAMLFTSWEEK